MSSVKANDTSFPSLRVVNPGTASIGNEIRQVILYASDWLFPCYLARIRELHSTLYLEVSSMRICATTKFGACIKITFQ